jgi:hypothetical protein
LIVPPLCLRLARSRLTRRVQAPAPPGPPPVPPRSP